MYAAVSQDLLFVERAATLLISFVALSVAWHFAKCMYIVNECAEHTVHHVLLHA